MNDKQLENIGKKLDTVIKLLAFDLIRDKSVSEQIGILTKAGLKASDIADLVDRSENQVYVTQTQLKKKKKELTKESTEQQPQREEQNV